MRRRREKREAGVAGSTAEYGGKRGRREKEKRNKESGPIPSRAEKRERRHCHFLLLLGMLQIEWEKRGKGEEERGPSVCRCSELYSLVSRRERTEFIGPFLTFFHLEEGAFYLFFSPQSLFSLYLPRFFLSLERNSALGERPMVSKSSPVPSVARIPLWPWP